MAKRKAEGEAAAASPTKFRRPSGYWAVFNAWWRDYQERNEQRPSVAVMTAWYHDNAMAVWGPMHAPPLKDMLKLSKGLRSLDSVKDYFRGYRRKKKAAKNGDEGTPVRRVSRVAKAGGAKPRRGRRAGSDSSDEEEDPDYGVDFETEEMEEELFGDLAGEEEEEVEAGAQQPQPQQQVAAATSGFLPHMFGSSTTAQGGNPVATAAAFIAAAAAAAAAARAAHAAGTGFRSASCGAQPAPEHDQLCYTPRPEMEDATASLKQQASWQHSAQHAAGTTALDPVGSGFTQPAAAQTASHAPSPAAATSPPTPSYTGAAGPVPQEQMHLSPTRHGHRSMEGAGCTSDVSGPQSLPAAATASTAPTGPAGEGATASALPRHLVLGGRFQTTAGSAPLPSHGSVPLPPVPGHTVQGMHMQQQLGSELPGGASRAHSMPCAAYPLAPGPQRHTAPSGSPSDTSAVPPPAPWQHYHPQQYPHSHVPYPHHPPPPPHGSAAAPAPPYRYGPAGYPPHPAYPHGYHQAGYSAYGYPPYGMPPPPYGYPPAPYGRYAGSASAPPPSYGPPHHPYPHAHGMPPVYPHSAGPQYTHPQQQPIATTTAAVQPQQQQQEPQGSGAAGSLELSQSLMLPGTSDGAALSWLPSLHDDVDLDAVLEAEMGAAGADGVDFLDLQQHQQPPHQQGARPSDGGHTDAFAELYVRWDTDKGASGAPAAWKDSGSANAPGSRQQRPCVQVHVFQE